MIILLGGMKLATCLDCSKGRFFFKKVFTFILFACMYVYAKILELKL